MAKTRKRKTIVLDFDGTCCDEAWPRIGKPKRIVLWVVHRLMARGHTVILNTCREGKPLSAAKEWLRGHGIWIVLVNENTARRIEEFGGDPRKVSGDYVLDDKACASVTLRALWLWLRVW